MIVEANWGAFAAKFNGREQKAFEWFCSLLFAKEHKQPIGPLRYFNQAGIEEDPITVGSEVIGWQAKFVDKLSGQVETLKKAIDDAKLQNPSLTQIYFYISADFAPSRKSGAKEPKYKTEVEEHARSKGVSLTWRMRNFFEKPLVCEENANIARYFFTNEKSAIDLIQELTRHTEAIPNLIRPEIASHGAIIKIDRSSLVARLKETLQQSPVVIVCGEAGVGKTAVVKDFRSELAAAAPLFVFKATEFSAIANVNQLFKDYGNFTLSDLIQGFSASDEKYVVVDSAEELSSIEHPEVFQEILSTLRSAGWKVIFTTRLNYLEDLERTLIHVYGVSFKPLAIESLTAEELAQLAENYSFVLPENERLCKLLQNPFYLNEYLRDYPRGYTKINYSEFRDAMWNTRIAKTADTRSNLHRRREQCFLEIARKRANTGSFFVAVEGADEVLPQLEADEIIKYDEIAGGYFVAHDIYAEWALDKLIERAFRAAASFSKFYETIGSSLPIRRAFRVWLSEKLLADDSAARRLIEETIDAPTVERHWRDEVIVAAMLSPYAEVFIDYISAKLLSIPEKSIDDGESTSADRSVTVQRKYEDRLLTKILFLLRIACKDVDHELLKALGAQSHAVAHLFAKPKGAGWHSVVAFISRHRGELGLAYMNLVLPVLDEWNRYNKQGVTTRHAAQLALFYYEQLARDNGRFPYGIEDDTKERLIKTIFNGAAEIVGELRRIFTNMVSSGDVTRRTTYYELAKALLSDVGETSVVSKCLPTETLCLAELYWVYTPPKERRAWYSDRSDLEMESYFDLASNHSDYYPASAFQTPIFNLMQVAPKEAADFILRFTNRAVEHFAQTELGRAEVEEIEIHVDGKEPIRQLISSRIWNLYRGTQVAPVLLESIHMALERWLLAQAKMARSEVLEGWCLYLIEGSRSASITGLVTSIVLAEPNKLFNVAKVLFRTKELFLFETERWRLDMSARGLFAINSDRTGVYANERLRTCDDSHRKMNLEHLALKYQLFRSGDETEEVVGVRQEIIWRLFDDYYATLPDAAEETDGDKIWRLYLARMDRRKMNISTETKDDKVIINFNPEIDPELRQYSDEAVARTTVAMQYTPLKLWAHYRYERNEEEYKKYPQYDGDAKQAFKEMRGILEGVSAEGGDDGRFSLFYRDVPAHACAVLLRDKFEALDASERDFCKDVVLDYASASLDPEYRYQVSDGVSVAVRILPLILRQFPEEGSRVRALLLFVLLNEQPAGMSQRFSDFAVSAVVEMWGDLAIEANALLCGYLLLKPRLDAIRRSIRDERWQKGAVEFSRSDVLDEFTKQCQAELERAFGGQITHEEIPPVNTLSGTVLATGFSLLPIPTTDERHKEFARALCKALAKRLLARGEEDKFDYTLRLRFFDKLALVVLQSEKEDIRGYLQPLLEHFGGSREVASLLSSFVSAEDKVHQYEQFWSVWELFYPSIKELCERRTGRFYGAEVVHNYLLAWPYWRQDAKTWRSLQARERAFFKRVAEDMGDHPAVLYSLAKFLNEIGSEFVEDGISWISSIIERVPELVSRELEVNTIYYLENLVRAYLRQNRHKVRTTPHSQHQMLTTLNFLLERGSATAYLLREDIL
ncbi:AVAST type 4 anti-phage nuclease Avs4 [Bradyrhizobium sp. ORS 285]|uniref:AVAST type 4 anti-phage nuclease Avs4 n=1 Tax=Bradyrhizobium sp. ORS 285 TaxID=115808 RepID=UPI000B40C0B2|nr:AVAST type 4 anti-phage nuclease Avs4 [Bradyrhizobium sp. ORS 285]